MELPHNSSSPPAKGDVEVGEQRSPHRLSGSSVHYHSAIRSRPTVRVGLGQPVTIARLVTAMAEVLVLDAASRYDRDGGNAPAALGQHVFVETASPFARRDHAGGSCIARGKTFVTFARFRVGVDWGLTGEMMWPPGVLVAR